MLDALLNSLRSAGPQVGDPNDPERQRKIQELNDATALDRLPTDTLANMQAQGVVTAATNAANAPKALPYVASAITRIPSDTLNVTLLPRALYNAGEAYLDDETPSKDKDFGFYAQRAMYGKEGNDAIKKHLTEVQAQLFDISGDAETTDAALGEYLKSDEYKDFAQQYIPWNERVSANAGDAIDTFTGAPLDKDKTPLEFGATAVVQAVVPFTAASKVLASAASASIRAGLRQGTAGLSKVALTAAAESAEQLAKGNPASKLRFINAAIDLAMPGASTLNKKRILTEAGISGGLAYGIAKGIDVLVNDEDVTEEEEDEDVEDNAIASLSQPEVGAFFTSDMAKALFGFGAAATIGTSSVRRIIGNNIPTPNSNTVPKSPSNTTAFTAPPSNPATAPNKVENPASFAFSELTPMRTAFDKVYDGVTGTKPFTSGTDFVRNMTLNWRSNKVEGFNNFVSTGQFPGSSIRTVPFKSLENIRAKFIRDGIDEDYNKFRLAESELDTRRAFIGDAKAKNDELTLQIQNLQSKQVPIQPTMSNQQQQTAMALNKATDKQITALYKERAKYFSEHQQRTLDDPDFRHAMPLDSSADLEALVNAARVRPEFIARKAQEAKFLDDHLKYRVENGTMSRAEADAWRKRNPNYTPLYADKYRSSKDTNKQATGIDRIWQQVKERNNIKEYDSMQEGQRTSSRLDASASRVEVEGENRVHRFMDTLPSMEQYSREVVSFTEGNTFARNVTSALELGISQRKAQNLPDVRVMEKYANSQGRSIFSIKEAKAWNSPHVKGPNMDGYIAVRNGGDVSFYKFNDPTLHYTMTMPASTSIPVLSTMSTAFRQVVTGPGNPLFAPVSAGFDVTTIQGLRPRGSVYGLDAMFARVAYRMGFEPSDKLIDAIRTGTNLGSFSMDPVPYGMMFVDAARLAYAVSKPALLRRFADDIRNDTGPLGAFAKQFPQQAQAIEKAAAKAMDDYHSSTIGQFIDYRAVSDPQHLTLFAKPMISDRYFEWAQHPGMRELWTPFAAAGQMYKTMFGAVRESAKLGYGLRNAGLIKAKYNGDTTNPGYIREMNKLMTDVRNITGDMAEKPGSPFVQGMASIIPYQNIMYTSTRNFWQRARENPAMLATFVTPLILGRMYSDWYMSNWDNDAYNYYWREQPTWKRTAGLIMPTPSTWLAHSRGETVPFTPDAIIELPAIDHILRPFVHGVSEIVRYLGVYKTTQDDWMVGNQFGVSFNEGMSQAFGIATPPGLNAMSAALGGPSVDINKVISEGGITSYGSNKEKSMNANSSFGMQTMNVVGSLMGTFGKDLMESVDTTFQTAEEEGLISGIINGASEMASRSMHSSSTPLPLAALGISLNQRKYQQNPATEQYYKKYAAIRLATTGNLDGRLPGKFRGTAPDELMIPYNMLRDFTKRVPIHKKQQEQISNMRKEKNKLLANKSLGYNDRLQQTHAIDKVMIEMRREQLKSVVIFEDNMKNMKVKGQPFNEVFKAKYGKDFTLENWREEFAPIFNRSKLVE